MGMIQEFRDFAMKGNVVDMAVGVVIGGAFGKIVNSLVEKIIMPCVSLLTQGQNFADKAVTLGLGDGAAKLGYGAFVQTVIDFLIISFAIFLVVKAMNTAKARFETTKQAAPVEPTEDVKLLREIRDALAKR